MRDTNAGGAEGDADDDAAEPALVLYASGEESMEQLAGRAERLGLDAEVGAYTRPLFGST